MKDDYIFTTTNPFGIPIRLKSDTWNKHITGGHNYRPELIGQESLIEEVVSDPKFIVPNNPDDSNDTRQKYIDIVSMECYNSLKGLVVVVDHENPEYGDIVTIISKNRLNQEKGGPLYVRSRTTRIE